MHLVVHGIIFPTHFLYPFPFVLCRKVVECGLVTKHCEVEVYLMEFKLCLKHMLNTTITKQLSRATTVGGCL